MVLLRPWDASLWNPSYPISLRLDNFTALPGTVTLTYQRQSYEVAYWRYLAPSWVTIPTGGDLGSPLVPPMVTSIWRYLLNFSIFQESITHFCAIKRAWNTRNLSYYPSLFSGGSWLSKYLRPGPSAEQSLFLPHPSDLVSETLTSYYDWHTVASYLRGMPRCDDIMSNPLNARLDLHDAIVWYSETMQMHYDGPAVYLRGVSWCHDIVAYPFKYATADI